MLTKMRADPIDPVQRTETLATSVETWDAFNATYLALTEQPPGAIDEGEASRDGCQCGCEKPPEEGEKS